MLLLFLNLFIIHVLSGGCNDTDPDTSPVCDPPVWLPNNNSDPDAGTIYATFFSQILNTSVAYRYWVPANYTTTTDKLNVLLLFHGGGGNLLTMSNWTKVAKTAMTTGDFPERTIIIQMNGLESMYVNSNTDPAAQQPVPMESVINELLDHIHSTFRTYGPGARVGIAGFSMGGFGALHWGGRYPSGKFGIIYAMSPAIIIPLPGPAFVCTFANETSYFYQEHPNSLWTQATVNTAINANLKLQLVVAINDNGKCTTTATNDFHNQIGNLSYPHLYTLVNVSGHSYEKLLAQWPDANNNSRNTDEAFKIFIDNWINISPPSNVVVNPGFENGNSFDAYNWTEVSPCDRRSAEAHSGTYSMRCLTATSASAVGVAVPTATNTYYTFSGWFFRNNVVGNACIDMNNIVGEATICGSTGTSTWQFVSTTWYSNTTTSVQIRVYVENTSNRVYFDDISLTANQ